MKSDDEDNCNAAIENLLAATQQVQRAITEFPYGLSRRLAPTALANSPRRFLVYCAFVHLMKNQIEFFASATSVLVITVPKDWPSEDFDYVMEIAFKSGSRSVLKIKAFTHPQRNRKGTWDFDPSAYLAAQKLVVFLPVGSELHPEFQVCADASANLQILTDRHLDSLARQLDVGPLSDEDKEFLRKQNPTYIGAVFRKGKPARMALARLKELSSPSTSRAILPLSFYGAAGLWGHELGRDLELWRSGALSWSNVDKGILLYGPPGVGKTSFAESLATASGVHLVPASLAKWQSHGHLGDLLKAMRIDFHEARERAPSILFIDEVDSFGDRRSFSGDNKQYSIEVVNALLEAIDGVSSREGVVVVASTNYPERLDSALVRPGRLEKHVELSPPTAMERESILKFYLPELAGHAGISRAARTLGGKTGADLEYAARKARHNARAHRRDLEIDDLTKQVLLRPELEGADLWRICIHEAAHALVATVLNVGRVKRVEVFDHTSEDDTWYNSHGRTWIEGSETAIRTERFLRADIAMGLAGMAAEETVCGHRSTTSGGSRGSDLAKATEIAVEMVLRFGLGRHLSIFPEKAEQSGADLLLKNPSLRADVDYILDEEYRRSKEVLSSHKERLVLIGRALRDERALTGERLGHLLSPLSTPHEDAGSTSVDPPIQPASFEHAGGLTVLTS